MAMSGWKSTRSRGSVTAQLPLAICMVLAVVIVLLGKAEASIFDAARARLTDWSAPALDAFQGPVSVVRNWTSGLSTFFSTYEENTRLREENENLRRWQDAALALERRLTRYELLLNAVPNPELPSITAQVIGHSNRPFAETMILNAGANQDVRKGQAVLDDRGLLGRIYVTGEDTSWVLLLSDLNSRIPVVIRPSNRRAILAGNNSQNPYLQLDSGDMPVNPGDRVYSTGDGGLLPPEIAIGMVAGRTNDWRVALAANPEHSDYVRIVDYQPALDPPEGEPGAPASLMPLEARTLEAVVGDAVVSDAVAPETAALSEVGAQ
jgi:rod shape-determining protein MreC